MNGDRPTANGEHISNGFQQNVPEPDSHVAPLKQDQLPHNSSLTLNDRPSTYANGDFAPSQPSKGDLDNDVANNLDLAPSEVLYLIPKDNYLPMASLISRVSQVCWNSLSNLVDQLAAIQIPEQPPEQAKLLPNGMPNNQTKSNLDKKERLLKFANDQKADFIKLLVLLEWSKDVEEVSKTISINYWLMRRREAYWNSIASIAALKQEASGFQIPNPDLKTAAEVLSRGRVLSFPRLGYVPQKDLSNKQILRVLRSLNRSLSIKLALSDDLPSQLHSFHVHDGRATFTVPNEFELDVSVLDESVDSQFRMVDFRFAFLPIPHIPESLHSEIERYANANIDRDGLRGCYEFLHEMTLSYKLAEFHKQAVELSRNQWSGNIRVEFIRRNLIVQYWSERQVGKSWIEVGISSGRERTNVSSPDPQPFLEIKWMRQGKRVESLQLLLNDSVLCFEDILRQVIAQHSTNILDSIYDKLMLTTLFAEAELSLEQDISYEEPEECSLMMQIGRTSHLRLKVDPVTGLLVMSPVTERSERLQYEVNRIQGVADEVVSKLLNFRCSIMEAAVLAGLQGTTWEVLRAFKFSQTEVKALFGGPVVRINMFRQPRWGLNYALAVTHSQNGDHWWLLQQLHANGPDSQSRYQVIRGQKIDVKEDLSSAYFDRLAEYSAGVICLQRNADFFQARKEKFDLQPFPSFERNYKLPELAFELDMARPAFSKQLLSPNSAHGANPIPTAKSTTSASKSPQKSVRVRFGGVDPSSGKVTTIAEYQNQASTGVLRRLDESILDGDVILNPQDRTVTIQVKTSITDVAIPAIIDKAIDLEKIVSTVEQIHRLPGFKLKTITNSTFTIVYHHGPPHELGLKLAFESGSQVPQLDFFPAKDNPHQLLSTQYAKVFAASPAPFATKIRDFLTSLTLTLPLLTYLSNLQQKHGVELKATGSSAPGQQENRLRVHVLVRSATAFAIQYFMPPGPGPRDVGSDSQPQPLARLEILQHINASRKPMWLVRAALEEYQSYSRLAYSTPELGAKLRQEIFTRADGQSKWLALDKAAACMADQPDVLLQAMHDLLSDWVKQGNGSGGDSKTANPATASGNTASLPNGPNKASQTKAGNKAAAAANPTGPNGATKGQRGSIAGSGRGPTKVNTNAAKKQDVITLD